MIIGDYMIKITKIRHDCPEKAGFTLVRPNGHKDYTFLHFITPVDMVVKGENIKVKPGGCIIFSPGEPQWFKSTNALLHNWFHAEKSLKTVLDELELPENEVFYPADTSFISPLIQKAEMEFFSQDKLKNKMISSYITEVLCLLSRTLNTPPAPKVQSENFDKMRVLRQNILLNPEKHWSIKEMAQFANMSPSRFHGVYKSVFGTSPIKDSIDTRISYAKSILTTENIPITLVAEKLGYSDQYHFIRQFKKETGKTPTEYKKENNI